MNKPVSELNLNLSSQQINFEGLTSIKGQLYRGNETLSLDQIQLVLKRYGIGRWCEFFIGLVGGFLIVVCNKCETRAVNAIIPDVKVELECGTVVLHMSFLIRFISEPSLLFSTSIHHYSSIEYLHIFFGGGSVKFRFVILLLRKERSVKCIILRWCHGHMIHSV